MKDDRTLRSWIIVAGSGKNVREGERIASERLGKLLAREGYGLIAGTWAGVDEIVTRSFLSVAPTALLAPRIVHVENSPFYSHHELRAGTVMTSSPSAAFSPEAVDLADAGVVVGGRKGSKPTMDALLERGKRVLPFAWLGADALESFTDLLLDASTAPATQHGFKRFVYPLIDPSCAVDETVSRVLGGLTARKHDIFVSYHRADTGAEAGRAAHSLREIYGARRVFLDHVALPPAAHLQTLLHTARGSKLVIACIGPSWCQRVAETDDWVRQELVAAIEGGATLVPLFTVGDLPNANDVPKELQVLLDINGVFIDARDWDASLQRLVKACDSLLGITPLRPVH